MATNTRVYKILRHSEYDTLVDFGRFAGSSHDERDGYIHLSYETQVNDVLARFFEGEDVVIVSFHERDLAEIRVEDGFPHLYGSALLASTIQSTERRRWNAEGGVHELNLE
ncbi:MAG: DUF952 domain-containing protein [Myxococcota bacterium]